ncbi:MAG: hypothetical protein KBD48_02120 [Candidatus Pacebacteria bacterium]|nr:hypothetical protein [Candidatus Paceibacterota bacterium]MBP9715962.1 hypothetical protein [Candidatus Paceibacterota bacterium]
MKKLTLALCALSFLSFFSCKKDSESPTPNVTFEEPFPNELVGTLNQKIYFKRRPFGIIKSYFNVFISGETTEGITISVMSKHDTTISGKPYIVVPDTSQIYIATWQKDTVNVSPTTTPLFRDGWVFN